MSACSGDDPAKDLATFFEVSLDLLCIRDMDLKFNRVNRSWETVLGYTMAELEGAEMLPLVHPDDVAATRAVMQRMETEDEVLGFVNRYRHKDGGYRRLEWRAKRVGGKVFGLARDVTERMEMQADLEAAKLAAEAANQAKTDFLANISHEIRTPLNGVVGVLGVLGETDLTPAQQHMVALIESSAATLERLVSDLLDVSRIEAGSLKIDARPFALSDLDAVLETHRLTADEKGLAFIVTREGDADRRLLGDLVRLKQVLGNLVGNAVKFTLAGEVRVRMAVEATGEDRACRLTLEVTDTGVGFDAAFGEALFARFRQADATITRRFGGAGLGLAICKSLVELMGGEISGRSQPGVGSVFRVDLPLTAACPIAEAASPPTRARFVGDGPPLRVLLAEDHPVNRRVVELILGTLNVELTAVEDGAQALAAFEAGRFDLVLMDMQMPVMDGLAAVRAIRQREAGGRRTPIAMLSANAHDHHAQQALEAGADGHIAKPVTPAGLIAGMGEAIDRAAP